MTLAPSGLLNTTELAAALGVSREWVSRHRSTPALRQLEVKQAIGQRRYSALLVQRFLSGESVVRFGKGSRTW